MWLTIQAMHQKWKAQPKGGRFTKSKVAEPPEYNTLSPPLRNKKRTKDFMRMTLAVIVIASVLIVSYVIFLTLLTPRADTRGLSVTQVWRTNDGWFPTVENQGSVTLYITRFFNEKGSKIDTSVYDKNALWNDNGYFELPSGKFLTLILTGANYDSKEIYVEFNDGYTAKIYG